MVYMHACVFAADFANPKEAVKWLLQSASAGHVRAQYQLALCLHHGRGIDRNLPEAVWRLSYLAFNLLSYYLIYCSVTVLLVLPLRLHCIWLKKWSSRL